MGGPHRGPHARRVKAAYDVLVIVHVLTGALGLLSLALPLLARKGSRRHRLAGWVFAVAMGISMSTALLVSATWIAVPLVVKPQSAGVDPQKAAEVVRAFGLFFGVLGLLGGHALAAGLGAIGARRRVWPWLIPVARAFAVALLVAGPLLVLVGVSRGSVLLIAIGGLGTVSGIGGRRMPLLARGYASRQTVLVAHVEAMLGVATVATTAFFVQVGGRLGLGEFSLWVWALPVALGQVATVLWRRRARAGTYGAGA